LAARAESDKTQTSYMANLEVFAAFARQRDQDFYGVVEAWRKVKRAGINEREIFWRPGATLLGASTLRSERSMRP